MKITYKSLARRPAKTDLLVVLAREGKKLTLPDGIEVPAHALDSFKGEERETRLTDATTGPAKRVLLIGLGQAKRKKICPDLVRRAGAIAAKKASATKCASATFWVDLGSGKSAARLGQALAEGAVMGSYRLNDFKSESEPISLKRSAICGGSELIAGAKRGEITGNANCLARRLQAWQTQRELRSLADIRGQRQRAAMFFDHASHRW